MPKREDEYWANQHPPACTCKACNERRLGRPENRTWRYGRGEKPSTHPPDCTCKQCTSVRELLRMAGAQDIYCSKCERHMSLTEWNRHPHNPTIQRPAEQQTSHSQVLSRFKPIHRRRSRSWLKLIVLLIGVIPLATLGSFLGYHRAKGATIDDAVRMVMDDIRLAGTCPGNYKAVWQFVTRADTKPVTAGMSANPQDRAFEDICNGQSKTVSSVQADIQPTQTPSINQRQTRGVILLTAVLPTATETLMTTPTVNQRQSRGITLPTAVLATPTATPIVTPESIHQLMLDLINAAREVEGLNPVVLGTNTAAQKHAEEMLAKGYLSHWGLNGMKPYMRYALAGGYNYEAENVSGLPYRVNSTLFTRQDPKEMLIEAMDGLMDSPGHRRNILNKWHKKVNLGIAYDRSVLYVAQQFEGDYVEFTRKPSLQEGQLSLSGKTLEGFVLSGVQLYYDPPPAPLTLGQLGQTYCYSSGLPIVFLRPPPGPREYYVDSVAETTTSGCLDPYLVDKDTPPPQPTEIRSGLKITLVAPPQAVRSVPAIPIQVPWLDAATWDVSESEFLIEADLSKIIKQRGQGVYTVVIWAKKDGESIVISEYPIFID
jgi:uncharacterized protein YkwD